MITSEKIEKFCRFCAHRGYSVDTKTICRLTNKEPEFLTYCGEYKENSELKKKLIREDKIKPLAIKGRKKALTLSFLIGAIVILTSIFSYMTFKEFNAYNVVKTLLSWTFNFFFLYGMFIGNNKIRILLSISLFGGVIVGLYFLFITITQSYWAILIIPQIILYMYTFIFINFDKEFDAHVEIQSQFY